VAGRRLALDLHDGAIQPYIGLQLGLEAVRHKLQTGAPDVRDEIDRLLHLTRDELAQLRQVVLGLTLDGQGYDGLLRAIQRFCLTFTEATGIQVHLDGSRGISLSNGLAAEVFFIVTEALSNIRRHTQATTASIAFAQEEALLRVQIHNDGTADEDFEPFTPRSITERALALGGEVRIERRHPAHTVVIADIPL
jgi:signal transduction histidine kinase